MSRYNRPRHGNLKLSVEITSEVGAYSLIGMYLDLPVFSQLAEILIIVEEQVEFNSLHNLRCLDPQKYLIGVQPLGRTAWVCISYIESLRL